MYTIKNMPHYDVKKRWSDAMDKNIRKNAKMRENDIKIREQIVDYAIAIILAFVSIISIPSALFSFCEFLNLDGSIYKIAIGIIILITTVVALAIARLYLLKNQMIKKHRISEIDYIREMKINEINKNVFKTLYDINSTKKRSILRHICGSVSKWNPINYHENMAVYDIHEQIRSILIYIRECVIRIDPDRFNDRNVSVELVYCYPLDYEDESAREILITIPIKEEAFVSDWKLISSGDTSGNKQRVLMHLTEDKSFFTLVDRCGTIFRNNKYDKLPKYILERLSRDTVNDENETKGESAEIKAHDSVDASDANNYFFSDIRDAERGKEGHLCGTAIGTVIVMRNENPEKIFLKAILTINTYGESIFCPDESYSRKSKKRKKRVSEKSTEIEECNLKEKDDNDTMKKSVERDRFCLTEKDYEDIMKNTMLASFTKLLETELAQMYVRHSVRKGYISSETGEEIDA